MTYRDEIAEEVRQICLTNPSMQKYPVSCWCIIGDYSIIARKWIGWKGIYSMYSFNLKTKELKANDSLPSKQGCYELGAYWANTLLATIEGRQFLTPLSNDVEAFQ